jgi:hypothetical protein
VGAAGCSSRTCNAGTRIIDGEAVACDGDGVASFDSSGTTAQPGRIHGGHRTSFASSLDPSRGHIDLALGRETMARKSLTYVFRIVLEMAVVLAITTWAAFPTAPRQSSEAVFRA